METVVCVDRDGTLIYDDHYYLGKTDEWQQKLELMDGAVEGVMKLNEMDDLVVYMITNQSGVAVKDFEKLTEERAEEVCETVLEEFEEKGAHIKDYHLCPHVPPDYSETHPDREVEDGKVCHCYCIKPNTGMVDKVLEMEGLEREDAQVFVIGDRATDVNTGLNAGGYGVLVPFQNQKDQIDEVEKIDSEKTCIAENIKEAADFVEENRA
ncbi:MAG: HAD-IIIA family hydrolase [Candidatus Nanohaloarchaea archaeon]